MFKKSVLALSLSSIIVSYSYADCGYLSAVGERCDQSGGDFVSLAEVKGAGSELNFTDADVSFSKINEVISVTDSGAINFTGSLTVNGSVPNPNNAVHVVELTNNGTVKVSDDLKIQANMQAISAALRIKDSMLDVGGDAWVEILNGSSTGHSVRVEGTGSLKVSGTTTILNNASDSAFAHTLNATDSGVVDANKLLIITSAKEAIAVTGTASITSTGTTDITSNASGGFGIWFSGDALLSLGEKAEVNQQLQSQRAGIGQLNIGKEATVKAAMGIKVLAETPLDTHITIKGIVDTMDANYFGNVSVQGSKYKEVVIIDGGQLRGHIDLGRGDDEIYLNSGLLETGFTSTGYGLGVDMGRGNDHFEASGGKIIAPIVTMGTGVDTAKLSAGVDISELQQIDGGADGTATNSGELTLSAIALDGYTHDKVQAGKGLNMTNWDTLNLLNGAVLTLSDTALLSTTTAATKNNLVEIDSASMLQNIAAISSNKQRAGINWQTVWADVTNAGSINLSNNTVAGDQWTIEGDYHGENGLLILDTVLNDDNSLSDQLIITGNTSGSTQVRVNNIGGLGAQTVNGIKVIQVQGQSDGLFSQEGRIVAGAYDYFLVRGDSTAKNWYLSSKFTSQTEPPGDGDHSENGGDVVRPESGSYLGLIESNQSTFNHSFHDRQQRLDNQYQSAWARVKYTHEKSKAAHGQLENKTERTLIHFGADLLQQDKFHLGWMGGYAQNDLDTRSHLSAYTAKAKTDAYSVGVYSTWFDQDKNKGGLYVDTYAQYNWFDNKVNGKGLPEESFNTDGYTLSAEVGYGFILGQYGNMTWQVEPQVQFLYNSYQGKDRTEKNGTRITVADSHDFVSRVGARFQGKGEKFEPFVTLNYWNHNKNAAISMNDVYLNSERARNIFEVKAGGELNLNKHVNLFAQIGGSWGEQSTRGYGGNIGLKVKW